MEVKTNLAQEYVQEFDLEQLEGVVKREIGVRNSDRSSSDPNNNNEERLPSMHSNGTILMPPHASPGAAHHILTPPIHNGDEHMFPHDGQPILGPIHHHQHHHPAMAIYQSHSPSSRQEPISYHSQTPGTPPDTPPGSDSPQSPLHYSMDTQQNSFHCLTKPDLEESAWIHRQILRTHGSEPLDLRPNGNGETQMDWPMASTHGSVISSSKRLHPCEYDDNPIIHPGKGMRTCDYEDMEVMSPVTPRRLMGLSKSLTNTPAMTPSYSELAMSGQEDIIDDETLMSLSVRDLNKRLHGYPREIVGKLKQKRRTLKNRGYAQNCRSKRIQQKHDLESNNSVLKSEIQRLKNENFKLQQERDRYCQERDFYRRKADILSKEIPEDLLRRTGNENLNEGLQNPVPNSTDMFL